MKKGLLAAVSTLSGCMIGAGILAIPYVSVKAGFFTGVFDIIVLGAAVLVLYLIIGEIILRTKGFHQFGGLASIYIGKTGKKVFSLTMMFGIYGAMLAFLIKEGELLSSLLSPILGGTPFIYSLFFFIIITIILYFGIKTIEKSEVLIITFIILVVFILLFMSSNHINMANYTPLKLKNFFVPYGVIIFALLGYTALPEMKEEIAHNLKLMKRAIIIGVLVPIIIYLVFTFVVVGVTGLNTSEESILGLRNHLGILAFTIITIFGILSMASTNIVLGRGLKELYMFDFRIKKTGAWLLVVSIPLILFLLKFGNFIVLLSLIGALTLGIESALIYMMYLKAKKYPQRKPEYSLRIPNIIILIIIFLFIIGAVLEIVRFL